MAFQILAYALLIFAVGAGSVAVYQIRQNKQKIDKLEKSLDKSLAELADVLLTRMETTEHVVDRHHPNELEDERKKIRLEEKRQSTQESKEEWE